MGLRLRLGVDTVDFIDDWTRTKREQGNNYTRQGLENRNLPQSGNTADRTEEAEYEDDVNEEGDQEDETENLNQI